MDYCKGEDAVCQTQQCRRAEGHYQSNLGSQNTWAVPNTDWITPCFAAMLQWFRLKEPTLSIECCACSHCSTLSRYSNFPRYRLWGFRYLSSELYTWNISVCEELMHTLYKFYFLKYILKIFWLYDQHLYMWSALVVSSPQVSLNFGWILLLCSMFCPRSIMFCFITF